MKSKEKKHDRHACYTDTADVRGGFAYWFDKLLAYCLNMFEYSNLPLTLPARELESNLILTNHAVVFKYNGKIITARTNLFGYDMYYNATSAVYAQPRLRSKVLNLEADDVCVIYNSDLQSQILGQNIDGGLSTFIARYARLLADVESTLSLKLVNMRVTNLPATSNDKVRQSVETFYRKIEEGQRTVVSDNNIVPQLRNIDLNSNRNNETLADILYARDKIFECFMRELGVKFYQTKKAQVNVQEVNANDYMYLISIDDMLRERERGVAEMNKKFGTNVKVRINPKWGDYYNDSI